MQSGERSLDAALSILLRGATLHGRNLSLYRSSSVAGRPWNTVYNRFSILSPHSPPPPFFISPSWHWETRVAAGSNRCNDSGLRRGGKKEKKIRQEIEAVSNLVETTYSFFSIPSFPPPWFASMTLCPPLSSKLVSSFFYFRYLFFCSEFRRCFLNWKRDWKTNVYSSLNINDRSKLKRMRGPNVYSERTRKISRRWKRR